jgi:hypothetical protein
VALTGPPNQRLIAIYYLGKMGAENERSILRKIASSTSEAPALKAAVRAVLEKKAQPE